MHTLFFKAALFLFTVLCLHIDVHATHIVGADIFIRYTGINNRYQILLNKYVNENSTYQDLYGADGVELVSLTFSKGLSSYTRNEYAALISNTLLVDNSNFCVNPSIVRTSLQVYSIFLDLNEFNVYDACTVDWQRCCRSSDITNISKVYSSGSFQEQEIYIFTKKYQLKTTNNTPFFKRLSNEYFCRDAINTFDMSATDSDGDSLVYRLISPQQAPGKNVEWVSGYSGADPIDAPMSIDAHSGQITFIPAKTGIFVFGIQVFEYRKNVLISEVRKDFQFNVQVCKANNKPVIDFKDTSLHTGAVLEIPVKTQACIPLYITDVDASQFAITELISISSITDLTQATLSIGDEVTLHAANDTIFPDICIDPCLLELKETKEFNFHMVIHDRRCPAQYDTLDFTLRIVVPQNAAPTVFIAPFTDPQQVKVDSLVTFGVFGTDADPADLLTLTLLNRQRGMAFQNVSDSTSTIRSDFNWRPDCADRYPGIYDVYFIVTDNSCIAGHADTIAQRIAVTDTEVSFSDMNITNLVTPNGDGKNDFYHITGIPAGNCSKYFKGIEIYNRWGSRIYYSEDRFFHWIPEVSDGMYYYSVDLNDEVKKGWIQVTR